jgi:carbon-monoxide dehydrogenase medium subunit
VPLSEFFVGPCQTVRTDEELVTALRIPIHKEKPMWAYEKLGLRKADAISVVSAAAVRVPHAGTVRVALGAVAPAPIRAHAAEDRLGNGTWSAADIAVAARLAADEARPIDDVRGSAAYRKRQAEILVRRCLERVAQGGEARGA